LAHFLLCTYILSDYYIIKFYLAMSFIIS